MRLFRMVKKMKGSEKGVALIETLVALAILGLVAIVLIDGLATVARATFISDERTTAESLTRSEAEYLKSQGYIDYTDPGHGEYGLIAAPTSYSVEVTVVPVDPDTKQPLPSGEDQGIQRVTVAIKRNGRLLISVEDYKVDR